MATAIWHIISSIRFTEEIKIKLDETLSEISNQFCPVRGFVGVSIEDTVSDRNCLPDNSRFAKIVDLSMPMSVGSDGRRSGGPCCDETVKFAVCGGERQVRTEQSEILEKIVLNASVPLGKLKCRKKLRPIHL